MRNGDVDVRRVTFDSRHAQPGDLFVAIPGTRHDGTDYVPEALAAGAVAVAAEGEIRVPPRVGLAVVPSARRALGELASALFGQPSEHLRLVGVTGTDGKTTTCRLIAAVLAAAGRRVGWLTTAEMAIGNQIAASPFDRTTPEASDLQGVLARFVGADVEDAVVEVSSHALALDRVAGCTFDAAVFTNLAPEHLDFHGTLEAYAAAKARLFEMLDMPTGKRWSRMGVVNADDPASVVMAASSPAGIVSYGMEQPADLTATRIDLGPDRTQFVLVTPLGDQTITTRLLGRHNVANWLAAASVALGWGIDLQAVAEAAEETSAPPGRLQRVQRGQPFDVFVDYAHTPQALEATLGLLRGLTKGRLYLVFAMPGRRDAQNRPRAGEVAARHCDFFFISTDDPLDEDPTVIAEEVATGVRTAGAREGQQFRVEVDRRLAIFEALKLARPGDTVLLAGKGHEQRMLVGDRVEPWSDAGTAVEALTQLGYG